MLIYSDIHFNTDNVSISILCHLAKLKSLFTEKTPEVHINGCGHSQCQLLSVLHMASECLCLTAIWCGRFGSGSSLESKDARLKV